jgi:hypothetical protein
MEWVQGQDFIGYVESNIQIPQKLLSLGHEIVEIVRALSRESIAHGDLQHGNILIANEKPKLIDYDGMYVPAFKKNWTTHEAGHSNYQLPRDETDFGPGLDNFSVWVIYLSLRALSVRPSLWKQFKGGDDCLLFRRKDFESPTQSPLLQELKRIPEIQSLVTSFQSLLSLSPLDVPPIDPGSPPQVPQKKPGADWISTHYPPASYNHIPRPNNVYIRPTVPPASSPTPWPTTIARTIPPKPVTPSILVSPPTWRGPTGLTPVPPQPAVPSILHSPPEWPGPTGLPKLPPKPIPIGVLIPPPPPMILSPKRNKKKMVPVSSGQRLLAVSALVSGSLFILALPFAALVASTSSRLGVAVVFLDMVLLVGFLLLGAFWLRLEWIRREIEQQLNEEYETELAQLRAEAKRKKREWEADLAAKQALAKRHYEQELKAWKAEVAANKAEGQRQHKQWQAQLAARQAEVQGKYEQERRRWQYVNDTIQAEGQRQKKEWEADLSVKQRDAQRQHEEELRSWQAIVSAMQAEKVRRQQAAKDAEQRLTAAEHNWTTVASRFVKEYDRQNADLVRLKSDRNNNEVLREAEYKQILARARENQFAAHLSQELIVVAAISDIGPARKKTLQAHGVRTAMDIDEDRIMRIPGFKEALTANLMEWRRNVEARFIFKAAFAMSPQEKHAFEAKYEHLRQLVQRQIVAGETELKRISQDAEKQLSQLTQQIKTLLIQLHQAGADLTAIPKGL